MTNTELWSIITKRIAAARKWWIRKLDRPPKTLKMSNICYNLMIEQLKLFPFQPISLFGMELYLDLELASYFKIEA